MSDRTNRDIGNKRNHQKNKRECSCWYCISGKEKKRILKQKEYDNQTKKILRLLP